MKTKPGMRYKNTATPGKATRQQRKRKCRCCIWRYCRYICKSILHDAMLAERMNKQVREKTKHN